MSLVVRAKFQGLENLRRHAAVVAAVGVADDGAQCCPVGRAGRFPFLDQVAQGLLAGYREHNLADDAIGSRQRGVGQLEQDVLLAADALEIVEQFALDLPLGVSADAMNGLDQKVDQAVGERPAAQMRESRKRRQPKRFGMPTQFVRGLDRDSLAIAFDIVRPRVSKKIGGQPKLANQIELGQLGLQAVDARPARIGAQMHQHRRNRAVRLIICRNGLLCRGGRSEQGVESFSCVGWQLAVNVGAEALVIGMKRGANDTLDAISARRLDLESTAPPFEGAGQLNHIAIVGDSMIAQPFRQRIAIGDSRLAKAEQGADFGAVAFEGTLVKIEHIDRLDGRTDLSCYGDNRFKFDLRRVARKATARAIEQQQHRERQLVCSSFGRNDSLVRQAKRPAFGRVTHDLIHQRSMR